MYKTLRVLICAAVLCLTQAVQAQEIGNTPYSRYGLGELNYNLGSVRNMGMGGIGVSAGNSLQPNTANPALLFYNSTTVFDMGVSGQVKSLKNGSKSQTDANANLSNITLGLPLVHNRWSTAISLRPYSAVDYQIVAAEQLTSKPDAISRSYYEGDGGLSELYFGHGFRITKGLTVGVSGSYIFGTITKESSSLVEDTTLVNPIQDLVIQSERIRYNDLLLRAGANYRQKLNDKLFLSAGAVYSLPADIDAKRVTSYERRTIFDAVKEENIMPDTVRGSVSVPSSLRAGISIDNGSNLTVGAEFFTQNWSEYRNTYGEQELADSYRMALGAEYTPNANAIDSYFKRVTYRGGLMYGKTPYQVNGEQIKDMALTMGFTFPMGRQSFSDLYQFNTAFAVGRRGETGNGLIAENYLQFSAGITVNSRWFMKRRIE